MSRVVMLYTYSTYNMSDDFFFFLYFSFSTCILSLIPLTQKQPVDIMLADNKAACVQ